MSSSSSGDGSSPPSDSSSDSSDSSNNNSPPPPDSSDSSSSSPPPPDSSSSSSPPPPPSEESPPPPQDSNDSQSPPPPPSDSDSDSSSDNSSPPPPPPSSSNDDNNNNDKWSPPPPPPPPPPHHGALSPPKHKSSPSKSSKHKETSSNENDVIAGAIAGAALLLLVLIALLVCCCCRKKKKRRPMGYYMDNSQQSRNDYFNNGQHINWNNTRSSSDNLLRMPPSGQVSSEQGWPIAPPPPPPMMCSSEMSSAAFSGQAPLPPPHPAMALGFNQSTFTYDDLAAATGGFAQANLLGQGGFGYVHKGILPNGKEVAVKSLKANSGQGEREFQAEVEIISRVHHRHLVSLVGYCIAGAQRMLVYEFVTNNTLEHHLHGKGSPVMDFPTRLKIAIGSAKGLAYLHEDCHPRIIHRDIKTPNILLDSNFEAKVADFGLAKLSSDTNTHVSTRIMGTFGYLAPEYASSGKLSEKSDVFSYGVMLLELVTGKRPIDVNEDESLVDWARPILMHAADGGSYQEMVDPRLEDNYDPDEMLRMVASAGACIRHSARRRPKMSQIVRALEGDVSLEDLNGLKPPGQSPAYLSGGGSDYDSYQMDIRKPRTGISSQEFTSGEYGGESQEMRPIVSRRPNP